MKHSLVTRIAGAFMVVALPLSMYSGCESSAGNAGLATGLSTFAIGVATGHDVTSSAIAGGIAGYVTYRIVASYEASLYQQRAAYSSGEVAVRRTVVRHKVESSHARVVAVRVPKSKENKAEGTPVMLVNKDTGKPVDNKVRVVQGNLKDGEEAKIGGNLAVFSGSQGL